MFSRLRCLLRLHRWQLATDSAGSSSQQCRDCSKSKRFTRVSKSSEDSGGYGNLPSSGGGFG